MKTFRPLLVLTFFAFIAACDVQSGITKKSVEKFEPTPTPEIKIAPEEPPINPADVLTVDTSAPGPQVFISKPEDKTANCDKFNRVSVNGSGRNVTIKGVCSQVMINGLENTVVGTAFAQIVLNGHGNNVQYSKYANGKRPLITDNGSENTILKTEPPVKK